MKWGTTRIHRHDLPLPVSGQRGGRAAVEQPADWISPGFDGPFDQGRWLIDPPANNGSKVVLLDTDHFSRSRAPPCGCRCPSSAATTRSCTTWAFSAAAYRLIETEPNRLPDAGAGATCHGDARGFAERIGDDAAASGSE